MSKTEHVILDKDQVCGNPYCQTLIKKGQTAVKVTHLLDTKHPEYYHDEECAKHLPDARAIKGEIKNED